MTAHSITLAPGLWFDRYFGSLSALARSQIRDREAAADLVQDTFTAALGAQDKFRGDASEKSWLTSILRNKIVDFLRRRARRKTSPASALGNGEMAFEEQVEGTASRPGSSSRPEAPDAPAMLSELEHLVREALSEISPRVARAFVLREVEDRTTEEVCAELDITKAILWVMIHRARRHLQKAVSETGERSTGKSTDPVIEAMPRTTPMKRCG